MEILEIISETLFMQGTKVKCLDLAVKSKRTTISSGDIDSLSIVLWIFILIDITKGGNIDFILVSSQRPSKLTKDDDLYHLLKVIMDKGMKCKSSNCILRIA